ncbi:hypothetical protein FA13DRAFT_1909836 [Coprinellus micaceus]|uniref:Uncharacterized protein n=1 Tax=Coprinellus micaceus TaxID=71717 RepID=A0A4Y7SRD9_COPMI|nr:hypothetical protein FA13DRAFT_1909836 [Coprinellus micaceus]
MQNLPLWTSCTRYTPILHTILSSKTPLPFLEKLLTVAYSESPPDDMNLDITVQNGSGETPLVVAFQSGDEAIIRLLLSQRNVDADLRDGQGRSSLHFALMDGLGGGRKTARAPLFGPRPSTKLRDFEASRWDVYALSHPTSTQHPLGSRVVFLGDFFAAWKASGWWSLGVPASRLDHANPRYSDSTRVHTRVERTLTTPISSPEVLNKRSEDQEVQDVQWPRRKALDLSLNLRW